MQAPHAFGFHGADGCGGSVVDLMPPLVGGFFGAGAIVLAVAWFVAAASRLHCALMFV